MIEEPTRSARRRIRRALGSPDRPSDSFSQLKSIILQLRPARASARGPVYNSLGREQQPPQRCPGPPTKRGAGKFVGPGWDPRPHEQVPRERGPLVRGSYLRLIQTTLTPSRFAARGFGRSKSPKCPGTMGKAPRTRETPQGRSAPPLTPPDYVIIWRPKWAGTVDPAGGRPPGGEEF